MKTYKIKARSMSGALTEETISANSEVEATRIAADKGLFVTDIKELSERANKRKMLNTKELIIFSQLMSAMLNAGTSIDRALNLARAKADNERVRDIYTEVFEEVQKGTTIQDAMQNTGAFPQLLVNMVSSGATTGNLGDVFLTMADYYEKDAELNRKIKGAMVYPIVLGVISVVAVVILTVFVLPQIMESFEMEDVPMLTSILMNFSNFLITKWYLIIVTIIGAIFGIRRALDEPSIRIRFDKFKTRMPIVGPLLRTIYSARASRTISSLYMNGARMITIVEETGGTIGNSYIHQLFDDIYVKVSSGERLSAALAATGEFDPMLYSMLEVGEETGDLSTVLASTTSYFNNEAEGATERLVQLLEPIFLIVMGLVIGIIVIAILQPLLGMYDSV